MEPKKQDIEVRLLNVDTENFRIGDQDNTRAAYLAMIEEEGTDIVNLAQDIIEYGLSPAESLIVCPDPDKPKHYTVCEGNRRLTSIRLLENPSLAIGTPVHRQFVEMSPLYIKKPIKKVSCVIVENKTKALHWIERKHLDLGGRGVARWGATATARADQFRGKVRRSLAVIEQLKRASLLTKQVENEVSRQTTNLDRVFQMPYFASALGVKIEKDGSIQYGNGDEKKGNALLLQMVKAMAAKGFNVNDIRSNSDRENFIDKFAKHAVLPPAGGSSSGTPGKTVAAKAKTAMKKVKPLQQRTSLAIKGKGYVLEVSEPRLNSLYEEARNLNVSQLPNCGGILTRVFLELSTDYFLKQKKVAIPQKHLDKGRKQWPDIGIPLKEKMEEVMKIIDPSGKDAAFKEVRKGITGKESLHSIDALHSYIHQLTSDPDPSEIKRIWTRWHPYFDALFSALV